MIYIYYKSGLVGIAMGILVLLAGLTFAATERAAKPAFKGMELYSWMPEGGAWNFSLLEGTNREKTEEEIKKPERTVVGLDELKKRLAELAEGEHIFWTNLAKEQLPQLMADDLKAFCNGIKVELLQMW